MANIKAFSGIRYSATAGKIDSLVCPPYDIINEDEKKSLYAKSERNMIRIEYGLAQEGDNAENNVYTRAKACLSEWLAQGVLQREDKDCLYVYEMVYPYNGKDYSIKGLLAAVGVQDYADGVILPHEHTLNKAKTDRLDLLNATACNTSPIYTLYTDHENNVRKHIDIAVSNEPAVSFKTIDNILHKLWIIRDDELISRITEGFADKKLYIADGHHRYQTALTYKKQRANHEGSGYALMYVVDIDESGLLIQPTHRMLNLPATFDEEAFIANMRNDFFVQKLLLSESDIAAEVEKAEGTAFALYKGGEYFYMFTLLNKDIAKALLPNKPESFTSLDLTVLHTAVISRYMGISAEDMANDCISYTKSVTEAMDKVRQTENLCAFIVKATAVTDIVNVCDSDELMPQKSTYFYPKPITGLVLRTC